MTTPGGVPNLPPGALTLDTLAAQTQDMTPEAMKARAADRFSSIFSNSTGLSPASDITPFGILTGIFSGFNSSVANADPADIDGPEDLPGLLVEWIEGLPVVGQFVEVLEAIVGTYDGDDATLLAVQEIFAPIRMLLLLISGQGGGIPTVEQITAGWADLLTALNDSATELVTGSAVILLGLFGILGNQVGSLQNQLNSPKSISIPQSAHDGEASVIWENCDTDIVISPLTARGAFIRPESAQEKTTLKIIAYKGSGCTGVYFDLVKLDPTTGGVTRVYQSGNEASNLPSGTTSADYTTLTHTAPVDAGVVVANGDNWGWQISTVGGNITVRGKTDANPALTTRPLRRGFARTITSGARMPTSLTQSLMDSAYNAQTPYIEWDIDKVEQIVPRMFYDSFNRDVLGDDWVSHRTTLVPYGLIPQYLTIIDGKLSFTGTSFVGAFEGAFVRWPATMVNGGMRTTVQVRNPSNSVAYFLIAGSTDWSSYVAVGVRNVAVDLSTGAGWTVLTPKTSGIATVIDGDYLSVDWISGSDRYDVYHHTTPDVPDDAVPLFSWLDSSHVVPHGAAYQYAGAMHTINGYVPSATFDNFGFKDIAAVTPTLPPPTVPGTGLPHRIPFRLGAPDGTVGPVPLAILELTSPAPAVLETVVAPQAILELTSPVPSTANDSPIAPLAILELTAPVPDDVRIPAQLNETFDALSNFALSGFSASTLMTATGTLNLAGGTSGNVIALSNSTFDMTGKAAQIQVLAHSGANHIDFFRLTNAANNAFNGFMLYFGTLYATASASNLWSVTFNPATHQYLRVRESAGTIYYDYSADSVTWTNATTSAGALFPLTAAYVSVLYQANPGAASTFDNLIVF